uniref:ENTH domain-containing protein n=1 Tax=Alexandrium catenella TaxID=2925 RepID=A0A7S1WX00_ALECA
MAVSALMARVRGQFTPGPQGLVSELRRITDSGLIDIPEELFPRVLEASHNVEDRRVIMQHLRECLAEPAGKQWTRIYGGLVLAENLVQHGSAELITETAEGRHFDLVQRLSFLEVLVVTHTRRLKDLDGEHFGSNDRSAQNLIRKKASALRADVVPKLQADPAEVLNSDALGDLSRGFEDIKDTLSTCSPKTCSTNATLTSLSSDMPMPVQLEKPIGRMIVNGIVTVGHSDDTTSGSSDEGEGTAAARRNRQRSLRRPSDRRRPAPGSEVAKEIAPAPVSPAPAACVDLLGL